jgi:hypothetical protein
MKIPNYKLFISTYYVVLCKDIKLGLAHDLIQDPGHGLWGLTRVN